MDNEERVSPLKTEHNGSEELKNIFRFFNKTNAK